MGWLFLLGHVTWWIEEIWQCAHKQGTSGVILSTQSDVDEKVLFQRVKAKVCRTFGYQNIKAHGKYTIFHWDKPKRVFIRCFQSLKGDTVFATQWLWMAESFGQTKKSIENLIQWLQTCLILSWFNMVALDYLHWWYSKLHYNRSGGLFANLWSLTSVIYKKKNRNTKNCQVKQDSSWNRLTKCHFHCSLF